MKPETKTTPPLLVVAEAAVRRGFHFEPPSVVDDDGRRSPNPNSIDGYPTLVRGPVRIALSNIGLYYHNGNVWWSDPCESHPSRVTVWQVVVDPEHRRQGLATEAMRSLQSLCRENGLWLQLEATPFGKRKITRRRLIAWYNSLGFSPSYPTEGIEILEWKPEEAS